MTKNEATTIIRNFITGTIELAADMAHCDDEFASSLTAAAASAEAILNDTGMTSDTYRLVEVVVKLQAKDDGGYEEVERAIETLTGDSFAEIADWI